MTPDERVEALNEQVRAIVHHSTGEDHTVSALVSWLATGPLAGVADLEAENARLRDENREYEAQAEQADLDVRLITSEHAKRRAERDSARRELLIAYTALGDLRAGLLVALDTYRADIPWQVEQDLRALLTPTDQEGA